VLPGAAHPEQPRRSAAADTRAGRFRYGAVFLLVLALVVFEILEPAGNGERAVGFGLAGAAFVVAVATRSTAGAARRRLTLVLAAVILVLVACIAAGLLSAAVTHALGTLLLIAIPISLARGLLQLVAERGATGHAIAGALAIYLMIGLVFASAISFVAEVQSGPYFTQGPGVTNGDRVYYSFTVMTTTGFGDFTAATSLGHALAVVEMLSGQIYLVTVIGVLIGHYVRRSS
jgi:hypothetical protein